MDNVEIEVVTEEEISYAIDTSRAYTCVKYKQDEFEYPILIEFRENLENILNLKKCVNAHFYPLDWKYHKGKYQEIQSYDYSWLMIENFGIFRPDYFLRHVGYEARKIYKLLSDENREKLNQSLEDTGEKDWEKYAYDICQLNHPCPLSIETDSREDFEYFFAWQLLGVDLFEIKDFLDWHIVNTFKNDRGSLIEFIKILFLKYKRILTDAENKEVVFDFLDKMQQPIISISETVLETDIAKKSGRKSKDKIEIPVPPKRNKERWTIFSKDDTIKLFDYLIQLECFVNDTKKVSKQSIAKAIYAITGYSDNDTAEMFVFENIKPKTKKEKEVIAENIKQLIINNL